MLLAGQAAGCALWILGVGERARRTASCDLIGAEASGTVVGGNTIGDSC